MFRRGYFIVLVGLIGIQTADVTARQQTTMVQKYSRWLSDDLKSITLSDRNYNAFLVSGVVFSGLSFALDTEGNRRLTKSLHSSDMLSLADGFGDQKFVLSAPALVFALTLPTKNTKLQDAAFTSLQSVWYTLLTVNTVKFISGRARPHELDGPFDFDPFEPGGTSFPSGHTAGAFALLSPWVVYYPGPLTYSLMIIPAGTAVARVAKGKHWVSDVVAGAFTGFTIGYALSVRHLKKQKIKPEIQPLLAPGFAGIKMNLSF